MKETKSEMSSKTILLIASATYCVVMLSVNFLSTELVAICMRTLVLFLIRSFSLSAATINVITMLATAVLDLVFVLAATFLFIRIVLPRLYERNEGKLWLKRSAFLVLPGELLRFFLAFTDLGAVDGNGKFAITPSYLFELVYLRNPNKNYTVRLLGEYGFSDYAFFSLIYALYLAVLLTGVYFICKAVWNIFGIDREDL